MLANLEQNKDYMVQVANLFQYLADEGLSGDEAIEVLRGSKTMTILLNKYEAIIADLKETRDKLTKDVESDIYLRFRIEARTREACIRKIEQIKASQIPFFEIDRYTSLIIDGISDREVKADE